jgi:hypothetical protein
MSDVDGTDLTKITGDSVKVIAEAAVAAAAPVVVKKAGWFLSRVTASVLAVVLSLVGGAVGFVTGRITGGSNPIEGYTVSDGSGSGSGSGALAAPAASGSAATEAAAPKALPYDAKTVAAEAVLGAPLESHLAHPADAATAAEADAK